MVQRTCHYCQRSFATYRAWLRNDKAGKYCSKSCRSKAIPHPSYKVEKVCIECGVNYLTKRYLAEKSKFCSRECQHKNSSYMPRGEQHPNWKGGVSERPWESKVWRRVVKERDGMCVECKATTNLHAHHLKSYSEFPESRFELDNGITLCKKCHADKHVNIKSFVLASGGVV